MLQVKIVCTLGPASRDRAVLTEMIRAGMNVARVNMSHGTQDYHKETIELVRSISAELGKPIAILADLQGPKLRVGKMQAGGVPLEEGEALTLTTDDIIGEPGRVPIQFRELPQTVQPGERILMDDGLLELEVVSKSDSEIETRVVVGGLLKDRKGMNLPDASLDIPALTEKDRADMRFAVEQQVDWIALSFVRTADEVLELKELIREHAAEGVRIPVVSKVEKPEAIRNIDAIIEASDAIMVARGDLGIEMSAEAVPSVQKLIVAKCHAAVRPVIVATHMLESMIQNPRPTRAEASDVANAVFDGADAVMLSGESATGDYPVEAVRTMARIAAEAERANRDSLHIAYREPQASSAESAIGHAVKQTVKDLGAKAILAPTVSGSTPRLIASFRPSAPIIAVTPTPRVQNQLALLWGTQSLLAERRETMDAVIEDAIVVAERSDYVEKGDTVVLTAGIAGHAGATNLMMVRTIG